MVIPTYEATPRLLADRLSPAVSWMAWRMVDLPLASSTDLVGVAGLTRVEVNRRLQLLKEAGLADCVDVGWYRRRSSRWWLTDRCLALMEWPVGWSWQDEGGRSQLLQRLAAVEGIYGMAGMDFKLGPFRELRWIYGNCLQAAVRYQHGWVAMFWSGVMETRAHLVERLGLLGETLEGMRGNEIPPVPSVFGVVVNDRWQRQVAVSALHEWDFLSNAVVWCLADESVSGLSGLRPSEYGGGWVSAPEYQRDLGGWSWEDRVSANMASRNWGNLGAVILDRAWEWPGMAAGLAVGDGNVRYGKRVLLEMVEADFLERIVAKGPAGAIYGLGKKGIEAGRRRDGVFLRGRRRLFDLIEVKERRGRIWRHEAGIMKLAGALAGAGLTVHTGFRCFQYVAGGSAISPDAVVWFGQSPFGPGWHYVEYEQSARRPAHIRRKLRGYLAEGR